MVKNPPAMWETWVRSLCWEDPLEEGMATHSSILAWRIPWTEEPGGVQSMGSQRVRHNRVTKHTNHDLLRDWDRKIQELSILSIPWRPSESSLTSASLSLSIHSLLSLGFFLQPP